MATKNLPTAEPTAAKRNNQLTQNGARGGERRKNFKTIVCTRYAAFLDEKGRKTEERAERKSPPGPGSYLGSILKGRKGATEKRNMNESLS